MEDSMWHPLWIRLEDVYASFGRALMAQNPGVRCVPFHWGNLHIPFWSNLSLTTDRDSNSNTTEDFVIELEICRNSERFVYSSELITGEGTTIFNGPSSGVPEVDFDTAWVHNIAERHEHFMASIFDYLVRNTA